MGKTTKPLTIIITDPAIGKWGEWDALKTKGHRVGVLQDLKSGSCQVDKVDLWVGPGCWCLDGQHRKYLPLAIAAARKAKFPLRSKDDGIVDD